MFEYVDLVARPYKTFGPDMIGMVVRLVELWCGFKAVFLIA